MNLRSLGFIIGILASCNHSQNTERKNDPPIEKITVLISGRGREIILSDPSKDTIIPNELSREIYLLELNPEGKLKTSLGYGQVHWIYGSDKNNIKLNYIEREDSTLIDNKKKQVIFSIAGKLSTQKEYRTRNSPTDSWLVKLKLNTKTSIYYIGEDVSKNNDVLNKNYKTIIDLLIKESSIKVREY
jgi:hypothetical protein